MKIMFRGASGPAFVAALFALGATALGSACGASVVGGECAEGYLPCHGGCVAPGTCSDDDGSPGDGDLTDGDPDGMGLDRRDGPCPPPPFIDAANCGSCGVECSGATPICQRVADGYACVPPCEGTLAWCNGVCVDTTVDPANCGVCGKFCPTGLCNGGKCRGAKSGHVAVIGHDYAVASPGSSAAQVVVNGVFLPSVNPVRVLAYAEWGNATAIANIGKILDAASTGSGRTYKMTSTTTAKDFADKLDIDKFDVALVYDQAKATSAALVTAGTALKAPLLSFGKTGGVVVALDGGGGSGAMPSFLTATGLLAVSAHSSITSKTVDVIAPADALGIDVLTPYSASSSSVGFTTSEAPSAMAVVVVEEPVSGAPVVIHKVVKK